MEAQRQKPPGSPRWEGCTGPAADSGIERSWSQEHRSPRAFLICACSGPFWSLVNNKDRVLLAQAASGEQLGADAHSWGHTCE